MHVLSVKKLRENFPFIRNELKKGKTFLIIYKSEPIAQLTPVEDLANLEEANDKDIENAAVSDVDEDFLTPEEIKYYLSL